MDQIENKRVMIVGADTHFSYLIKRYVRSGHHQIILANLGEDLPSLVRNKKPHVIVLEVDRPETIGWQTLKALKADPVACGIPVIVCSWLNEEALNLTEGVDIYLHMPILYADFGAALTATLMEAKNEENS